MKIEDANKACSHVAYLFSEVCAIYPITPSSPMAENIDTLTGTGRKNLFGAVPKVVEMESEMGAAGALHGALLSGSLASTFTASQGLLLMIPNMYKIAGEMLPGVIHTASRSVATHALSIFGDHSDVYAVRQTGWCMLASTNVDDAQNLAAVAHLSAIKASLPFIHFFDGFRTSHELNTVKPLDDEKLLDLIDYDALEKFRNRSLNIGHDKAYGTSQTEDVFFECMEAKNKDYDKVPDIVNEYMGKINKLTGKDYKPFNYYGSPKARNIIIAMGSVCDTIKLVIDNEKNSDLGLIEVHLYRPFSKKYLMSVLPEGARNIAVLDRTKEQGSIGEPLYLDIVAALREYAVNIVGGRYGLSSKNVTPAQIKAVYDMLNTNPKNNFTIGINDDVTNLSLKVKDYNLKLDAKEIKIYGFGSDGMVSASKDMLSLVNAANNSYVQGYFEYDSKKSGGVTICHLRMSDKKINAPYYVQNPEVIVVTKDEYFNKYDMLKDAKNHSILLINTIRNEKELNKFLPNKVRKVILDKKLNVMIINAEKIAYENNIKGKISKIMEVNILNLLGIKDAKDMIINSIKDVFKSKGQDIIDSNINAVNSALESIKKITITSDDTIDEEVDNKDILYLMNNRLKDKIKVSSVKDIYDGSIKLGTTKYEKRNVSTLTPKWYSEKCIECGLCSFVCPHSVIRAFAIKNKAKGKPFIGNDNYNFFIGISNKDCTSCGLCASICPTKSIKMEENVTETTKYFENYENPEIVNKATIKGISLTKPFFEFSGACAGCGETPYIKLLTSLFGEQIVIANATGCSSIYGGSAPSMPYLLPWANSLFEDNAEFAYGIHMSYKQKKEQIVSLMKESIDKVTKEDHDLFKDYLDNEDDFEVTNDVKESINYNRVPENLKLLKDYIPARTVWAIGGDGWAYDIGYNGIDHILHSGENIKILVLDTEVYSNTGGQASKSTKMGASARFADFGKKTPKKDLFKIASGIENVYAATICLGSNMTHAISVFNEAMAHKGPAIVIAYCPCIEHGIKGGMTNSISEEKLAVECGYVTLMRSFNGKLKIDSKTPNFDKYREFLENEVRFNSLKIKNPEMAEELLENQKENAIKRFEYYENLTKKANEN